MCARVCVCVGLPTESQSPILMYMYIMYFSQNVILVKAVTSFFLIKQPSIFYYLLSFFYSVNFTWRAMYTSIKYISLGSVRNSTDFFHPQKRRFSLFTVFNSTPFKRKLLYVLQHIFLRASLLCYHLGLYVVIVEIAQKFCQIEMMAISYFFLHYNPLYFYKYWVCVLCTDILRHQTVGKNRRNFLFPFFCLRQTKYSLRCCAVFCLDIGMSTYTKLLCHIYP